MSDYSAYTTRFVLGNVKFYTLYIMNDVDRPITLSNKILFTPHEKKLAELLELSAYPNEISIEDNGFTLDPISAINALETKTDANIVLDCLNAAIDFLYSVDSDIDSEVYNKVKAIADFLTFDSKIDNFFKANENILPQDIIQFINWSTGVIFNNSKIII